ncbi:CAP domain-containing protein [Halalkalicoccus salilacus]|uniref:CAP domain-containing protein n=1 Tax=Halalkalicoccus TaxID=332246 RepID=UPI002F9684EF
MTSDSNSDGDIDPERRTAIKSIGVFGTALTGLFGNQDKGLVPPDYLKDQSWKKGKAGCGSGRGKWCWSHGRGTGRNRGKGYERDHPHYDDDSHWRDNRKLWDDECRDEDPEEADDGPFRDPESPEEDVDEEPDEGPAEDQDEDPEDEPEESEEDTDEDPEEDVDEEPDEPEEDVDEEPDGDSEEDQDEEPDGDLDEEPEEDVDEEPDGDSGEDQDETDVATQIEMHIHEEVNDYRQSNGLEPLDFSDELAAVARDHSQDMNERDYFSHTSPEGDGPGDRLDDAGIDCNGWAENIAYEFDPSFSEEDADSVAESIVTGWINSTGHRRNILGDYDEEGVGVDISDDGRIMATQMFCSTS